MNPLMEQLHDIEGLDAISAWPLAAGWWIVITVVFLICLILIVYGLSRFLFNRSWKGDTLKKLSYLENNLNEKTARETVSTLSEYLRRIALKKYTRKECASLIGDGWLQWLSEHDPKQFDWKQKGTVLIDLPYAPLDASFSTGEIKDLIEATKHWVR